MESGHNYQACAPVCQYHFEQLQQNLEKLGDEPLTDTLCIKERNATEQARYDKQVNNRVKMKFLVEHNQFDTQDDQAMVFKGRSNLNRFLHFYEK